MSCLYKHTISLKTQFKIKMTQCAFLHVAQQLINVLLIRFLPFWKTWCTTALITYYTTERKIKAKDGECYQLRGFVLQSRVVNKGFFKKINI